MTSASSPSSETGWRSLAAQGVRTLFPGYFALVMATGIVSIATFSHGWTSLAWALFAANNLFYAVLTVLYLARLALYPAAMRADLTRHATAPTFLTAVAATCVLGVQYELFAVSTTAALALAGIGATLWVVLNYAFFAAVILQPVKPTLAEGLNGAWFLAVVSTQSVSVLASLLAPRFGDAAHLVLFAALCLYLLGCMLYLVLVALIVYRLAFFPMEARDLTPPYWINMGAVAITTLAGARLLLRSDAWTFVSELRPFLVGFTLFFWATATWWIPLLLVLGEWRYVAKKFPLSYHPAYWSLVFPLGMYTAATTVFAQAIELPSLLIVPRLFVYVAVAAWAVVFTAMVVNFTRLLRPVGPAPAPSGHSSDHPR